MMLHPLMNLVWLGLIKQSRRGWILLAKVLARPSYIITSKVMGCQFLILDFGAPLGIRHNIPMFNSLYNMPALRASLYTFNKSLPIDFQKVMKKSTRKPFGSRALFLGSSLNDLKFCQLLVPTSIGCSYCHLFSEALASNIRSIQDDILLILLVT